MKTHDSFVDFVEQNPCSMAQVADLGVAQEVIDQLSARGNAPGKLLRFTRNVLLGDKLLQHVADKAASLGEKEKNLFAEEVARLARGYVRALFWSKEVVCRVVSMGNLHEIVHKHPEYLLEDHPLMSMRLDAYWQQRFRRYFDRGDLERAWDELYKAYRGFLPREIGYELQPAKVRTERTFQRAVHDWRRPANACSVDLLEKMVCELFDHMVSQGILSTLSDADTTFRDDRMEVDTFELGSVRGRRRKKSTQNIPIPGFRFAGLFKIQDALWRSRPHIFKPTGAKIIKIALHWKQLEVEKNRAKFADVKSRELGLQ